jgi:hypothetical protein
LSKLLVSFHFLNLYHTGSKKDSSSARNGRVEEEGWEKKRKKVFRKQLNTLFHKKGKIKKL